MTIQELREKRSKAWDTARDFLDSKRKRRCQILGTERLHHT